MIPFNFTEGSHTRKTKEKQAFHSFIRNFGFAEVTSARKTKEKQAFLWFFTRLIVTLQPIWQKSRYY
jgi:hypothetical protein